MTVHLEPGTFYAGINRPFFISQSLVRSKIEDLGGKNIVFHPRTDPTPSNVKPLSYPGYDDSWDEWISADYDGPKKDLDVAKHWSWLLVVPKPASAPSGPPGPPATPTSSSTPSPDAFLVDNSKSSLATLAILGGIFLLLGVILQKKS